MLKVYKGISKYVTKMIMLSLSMIIIIAVNEEVCSASDMEKIEKACVEALEVIAPVNKDNHNAEIGDIRNVVDTEGKLIGYSIGYSVDGNPWGYAVYNIENDNISEFVFEKKADTLYDELEEKAEDNSDVNEDELIDCIVYRGGLDYCIFDEDGMAVDNNISDSEAAIGLSDGQTVNVNVKAVVNSSNNVKLGSDSNKNTIAIAKSYYYDLKTDYWKMHVRNANGDVYNCIPEWQRTTIGFDYYIKNTRKYGCTVSSGVGCLNWMGLLVNSSLSDTYNTIWEYNNMSTEYNSEFNTMEYVYDGLSEEDLCNTLNHLFNKMGSKTTARYVYRPTFTDIENSILRNSEPCSESHPVIMGIGGYDYDENGDAHYEGHSVIVDSYIKKKKSNGSYDNYIGIFQNYIGGNGSLNDPNSTFDLIKYINYDNLMSEENIMVNAILFDNLSSRNIKEPKTEYVSGSVIEVSCAVPKGTKSVYFPTWSANGGQDDLYFHKGTIQNGTIAKCSIDLNMHKKDSGIYYTHIYAYDSYDMNGNILAMDYSIANYIKSTISNIDISKVWISGYRVECELPTGTEYVYAPTWSVKNGKDDLVRYNGTILRSSRNDICYFAIDTANHANCGGKYITQIYAYDKKNNLIDIVETTATLSTRTSITSASIKKNSDGNIVVSCYVPVGTTKVNYSIFATNAGRSGVRDYNENISRSNGYVSKTINRNEFNNVTGEYILRVKAYDSKGRMIGNEVQVSNNIK